MTRLGIAVDDDKVPPADEPRMVVRETTSVSFVAVAPGAPPAAGVTPRRSKAPLIAIVGGAVAIVLVLAACLGATLFLGDGPDPDQRSNPLIPQSAAAASVAATTGEAGDGRQSGTLVSTYDVTLVGGFSIPLGDTAPTQSQFDEGCKSGDLCRNRSINAFFPVGSGVKLYTIAGQLPPTYAGCKATTLSAERIELGVGQTFCLLKNGRVVGVTITYSSRNAEKPVKFSSTVWADWPGSKPVAEPAPSGPAPGTQVGTYPVTIVSGSLPLTDAKPDSALIDPDCYSGDICRSRSLTAIFPVGVAVKLYNLEGAAPATYQACTTTTLNAARIGFLDLGVGRSFCVLRPGRVIGVTFTSMGRGADDPLVMTVTVWADALR